MDTGEREAEEAEAQKQTLESLIDAEFAWCMEYGLGYKVTCKWTLRVLGGRSKSNSD